MMKSSNNFIFYTKVMKLYENSKKFRNEQMSNNNNEVTTRTAEQARG